MKILNLLNVVILSLPFFFGGCASPAVPTGGKKDEKPPLVIKSLPENKSLNYKGQEINLVFDEYIKIDNLKQELLITPNTESNYEFEVRKNNLMLKFKKPFDPNTTYTFNFRKSIKDITENNVSENLKLVFSTGPVLDSLFIEGNVTDLMTNKPAENISVLLYKNSDTVNVKKQTPLFITKTSKEGNYNLENLKKGDYKIYALQESNNNLKYDQPKEKIAFLENSISLDTSLTRIDLKLSIIDTLPPKIVGRKSEENYFDIDFDEGLIDFQILAENNEKWNYQLQENKKVRIYNTANRFDTIPVTFQVKDSIGNFGEDLLKIKFNQETRNKNPKAIPFSVNTKPADGEKITTEFKYIISFNKPVEYVNLDKIKILADTIRPIQVDVEKDFTWNKFKTELTFKKKINIERLVKVEIPDGTFFSIRGDTSKLITSFHELKKPSDYGIVKGKINTHETNYIIQLVNESFEVIAEQINSPTFNFPFIPSGKYFIRVILDANKNGRWDQGNISKNILPEKVIFYPKEIPVKANWEVEQSLSI